MNHRSRIALALSISVLAACAAPAATGTVHSAGTSQGLSPAPTKAADLAGASILDVEKYQPQFGLAGCSNQPLPDAEGAIPSELEAAIARSQAYSDEAQGVGLIILHDGLIIHESYAPGVDKSTLTATASMMKSVMALTLGIALDKRIINSLDDPIGEYLEEWHGDPRGAITLRQLATMSSGLAPADFTTILLAPDIGEAALKTPMAGPADKVFEYNNAISQLLGMAIGRQVRQNGYAGFADFMQRELWCPLGNGNASLWVDASGSPRYYAGLHASLRDWARIGELIRNKGRTGNRQIVSNSWIEQMATPSSANPQYGLQLWLGGAWTERRKYSAANPLTIRHSEPFAASDIVFFDGFGGQRVYVIPSKQLTIARVGMVELSYDDAIIPNALIRAYE